MFPKFQVFMGNLAGNKLDYVHKLIEYIIESLLNGKFYLTN